MKKLPIVIPVILSLLIIAMNCTPVVEPRAGVDVNVPAGFSEKTTAFAFDFWQELNRNEGPQQSYFVSPLSLHIALGMLLNGAEGPTKTEIQKVLKTNDLTIAETNAIYKTLIEGLPKVDPKVTNTIANSIWQEKSFPVEDPFVKTLKDSFNAQHYVKNFGDAATLKEINQWASDNTNKKIEKILDEISPDQVMFLVNALYFKGNWKQQFDKKQTQKTMFTGVSGKKEIDLMNMKETLKFTSNENFQAVELPYGDDKYVMTVILPSTAKTTDAVLNSFSVATWKQMNADMQPVKVIVGLPKFKMEYSKKLNDVLKNMGITTAFSSEADLSKISPEEKLRVGFVKQDTYVAVDEEGTEAAAVTSIGIEVTSVPNYPEIICDRPFLFVISERSSNTIMFAGKIANL